MANLLSRPAGHVSRWEVLQNINKTKTINSITEECTYFGYHPIMSTLNHRHWFHKLQLITTLIILGTFYFMHIHSVSIKKLKSQWAKIAVLISSVVLSLAISSLHSVNKRKSTKWIDWLYLSRILEVRYYRSWTVNSEQHRNSCEGRTLEHKEC